ncbi:hypothetical protein [Nocardioides panaciterrulae]|uniref:Uncharacterized protein n=1 Tax=Nocardioides panaciterrulae TaxID=661492 RepID=A0A7Y9E6I4_9ACTN|nr:hypothetical protein [Nocardioides panaciterrulae]NYD42118.1 hypothetical protein [Nocardioides panaciterrulae]
MAYLMLYGVGWTQRWRIADGAVAEVKEEIDRVGRDETTHVQVVDPGSEETTTLVVAWRHVATAVVLGSEQGPPGSPAEPAGQYP